MFRVRFSADSNKNCTFQALFKGKEGTYPLLAIANLNGHPSRLKFESVSYTISEGCEVELFWDQNDPFMVLSGRGFIKFDGGIHTERENVQILNCFVKSEGTVCLFLDAEKQ